MHVCTTHDSVTVLYLIQQLHAFLEAGLLGAALGPSAEHLVYSRYVSGCIVQNAI